MQTLEVCAGYYDFTRCLVNDQADHREDKTDNPGEDHEKQAVFRNLAEHDAFRAGQGDGRCPDGDALRADHLADAGAQFVRRTQPSRIDANGLCRLALQIPEQHGGRRPGAGDKGADRPDQRRNQREGGAGCRHENARDFAGHARVGHDFSQGQNRADRHNGFPVAGDGFNEHFAQCAAAGTLRQTADNGGDEDQDTRRVDPGEGQRRRAFSVINGRSRRHFRKRIVNERHQT